MQLKRLGIVDENNAKLDIDELGDDPSTGETDPAEVAYPDIAGCYIEIEDSLDDSVNLNIETATMLYEWLGQWINKAKKGYTPEEVETLKIYQERVKAYHE